MTTPTPGASSVLRSNLLLAAVAGLVLIGAVARFLTSSPLWLDEALSVNIASLPLGDIEGALRRDGHPPLYYWLLHGWMEVFGDGDRAVRALSGVLSLATLPLIWAIGRRIEGARAARFALLVVALSPYAIRYASEARMYALVMLLVAIGYLLYRRVIEGPRVLDAVLLAATVGALLWTHYWSAYLLAVVGSALLVHWWRAPSERRATGAVIIAFGAGLLSFLPWLPAFLDQAAHTGTPWGLPARPTRVLSETVQDLGGGPFPEGHIYGIIAVVLVLLAALVHATSDATGRVELAGSLHPRLRHELAAVAATLMLGTAVGYVTSGSFASRYAAVVVPLVLVAVGVGMSLLPKGWIRWGLVLGLVGMALVGTYEVVSTDRTQAEELAAEIVDEAGPADVVVVCPDQLGPSIDRALAGSTVESSVVPYPTAGDPRFVDWRDYEQRNDAADPAAFAAGVLDQLGDGGVVWMVWNGTYRTFEEDCEAIIGHLGATLAAEVVLPAGDQFERADLFVFR